MPELRIDPNHSLSEMNTTAANEEPTPAESLAAVAHKHPRRLRRAMIGLLLGAGLIAVMQLAAPHTDHQFANMGSILVGFLTTIYIVYQLHRLVAQHHHWMLVPAMSVVVVAGLISNFQFDGFSGEMIPQFKSRFGAKRLETKKVVDLQQQKEVTLGAEAATAAAPSSGFLASDRTGVIPRRLFGVPRDGQVEILWNQGIGSGWSSFAVWGDRAVTLEQRDDQECVTCYRLGDGELLWMESHEAIHQNTPGGIGPRSTPTIESGRVYAQGATARVWCLDLETGEPIWTVDLVDLAGWTKELSEAAIAWGRAGSPLLVDGGPTGDQSLCVLPYGGPANNAATGRTLIALDAESGEVVWTAGKSQISFASPMVMTLADTRQIVSVNEGTISAHALSDGKELWSIDWPGMSNSDANCASVIPAGKDRFLIGKGYGGGSVLMEVTSDEESMKVEPVWRSNRVLKTKFTHACVDGPIAYAISNGSLESVQIEDGQRRWLQPRRSRFQQGQILLVDDVIVAQAEFGEVAFVAADTDEYRELARIEALDSKTWNIPTIAGRHLLVRNDRQVICFLLPARETP